MNIICWYCNRQVDRDCDDCNVHYHIFNDNLPTSYYQITFNNINLYAKCNIYSGIATIFYWNRVCKKYQKICQIDNWKWASISIDNLLKMIESLMLFS